MLSRSDWGARAPRSRAALRASDVRGVAIHWNGPAITVSDPRATLRGIQNFHMDTKRWADIAYNLAVFQDGTVAELRGLKTRSAANGTNTANARYVAIYCVLGQGQTPTPEMLQGVRHAVALVRDVYPKATAIRSHVEVRGGGTACPGPDLIAAVANGALEPDSTATVSSGPARITYTPENGDGLLVLGEKGGDIAEVQRRLGLTPDGFYGPKTKAAVERFQRDNGLAADGIVGPLTRAVMFPAPAPVPAPAPAPTRRGTGSFKRQHPLVRQGSRGDAVAHAQRFVGTGDDGIFGPATFRSVVAAQRARGLAQDGIVGPETWSRLHPVLSNGADSAYVREVQREVGESEDGKFGPKTEAGVREYQAQRGLTVDGIVGPQTYRAMLA